MEPSMTGIRLIKYLHRLFLFSIVVKGLDGLLEIAGGVLLLLSSRDDLINMIVFLTAPEIAEDPTDLVANYLRHAVFSLSESTKHFAAAYLLVNGVVKATLAVGLLRGQSWSYRPALTVLAVFIGYQLYRFAHTRSLILLAFMGFDLLALYLIWVEYRGQQRPLV
jgi:uncharacterized membrane protein